MLILGYTFRTFDRKVNKIKSQAKKKYYLQKVLKNINESLDLTLWNLKRYRKKYIEMLSKYPTAKDPATLDFISYSLYCILPEEKQFKSHVLEKLAELED